MKNKYGLLGFVSLLGVWGIYSGQDVFLVFFGFAVFFQYFGVTPDEFFVGNLRKCAAMAFFVNLAVTAVASVALAYLEVSGNPMAAGMALGFGAAILFFALATFVMEWRESWGAKDD